MEGEKLGKYEVRRTLGRGAMGVVYEGWDPLIARKVAIKTVALAAEQDAEAREALARFQREAQAAGRLQHPNIVGVFDYGETATLAYIVMEFVDGESLKAVLDRGERFPLSETVRILEELLKGLGFSHERGVVHRDIKPANIMLTREGGVKIADFGIARIESSSMTQAGTVLGTPSYMSPEQFKGEPVDARTDIYSTGVVLYQLLTGEKPFEGSVSAIMHKVLTTTPPKPSELAVTAPPPFDAVVAKAMAKRPEERFATAAAFAQAIRAAPATAMAPAAPEEEGTIVAAGAAPGAARTTTFAPLVAAAPRSRLPVWIGAVVVLVIVVAGGLWLFAFRPAPGPKSQLVATTGTASSPRAAIAAAEAPTSTHATPPKVTATQAASPAPAAPPAEPASPTQPAAAPASPSTASATPPAAPAVPAATPASPAPAKPAPPVPAQATASTASSSTANARPTSVPPASAAAPVAAPLPMPPPAPPPPPSTTVAQAAPTPPPPPSTAVAQAAPAPEPAARAPAPAAPAAQAPAPAVPAAPTAPAATTVANIAASPEAIEKAVASAIAPVPCSLVSGSVETAASITLAGLAGNQAPAQLHQALADAAPSAAVNWNVTTFSGGAAATYCRALNLLRPIATPFGTAQTGLDLALESGKTVLADGDPIALRVAMPAFAAWLSVDYFSSDGSVTHLVPGPGNPARLRSAARLVLVQGHPAWTAGPPYGRDMIVAIASARPLFETARPEGEQASAYLPALAAALDAARGAGTHLDATALLLETHARH